jgi:CDP-diacylglycerol pyrophosphatase
MWRGSKSSRLRPRVVASVSGIVLLVSLAGVHAAAERNTLWQVVSSLCVLGEQNAGIPFPCQSVDLARGFALLRVAASHLLLIPTMRVDGIESPGLLAAEAPNYWEYAWEARDRLSGAAGAPLPRDDVGLAVNSAQARTQDQLHIHIGCIRPDVRAALQVYEAQIKTDWSRLPFGVAGHRYRILRVKGDDLLASNPFKLLADGIAPARGDMASQTLVVVGAQFRDGTNGFYLLNASSSPARPATGENLLDYKCSVLLAH